MYAINIIFLKGSGLELWFLVSARFQGYGKTVQATLSYMSTLLLLNASW